MDWKSLNKLLDKYPQRVDSDLFQEFGERKRIGFKFVFIDQQNEDKFKKYFYNSYSPGRFSLSYILSTIIFAVFCWISDYTTDWQFWPLMTMSGVTAVFALFLFIGTLMGVEEGENNVRLKESLAMFFLGLALISTGVRDGYYQSVNGSMLCCFGLTLILRMRTIVCVPVLFFSFLIVCFLKTVLLVSTNGHPDLRWEHVPILLIYHFLLVLFTLLVLWNLERSVREQFSSIENRQKYSTLICRLNQYYGKFIEKIVPRRFVNILKDEQLNEYIVCRELKDMAVLVCSELTNVNKIKADKKMIVDILTFWFCCTEILCEQFGMSKITSEQGSFFCYMKAPPPVQVLEENNREDGLEKCELPLAFALSVVFLADEIMKRKWGVNLGTTTRICIDRAIEVLSKGKHSRFGLYGNAMRRLEFLRFHERKGIRWIDKHYVDADRRYAGLVSEVVQFDHVSKADARKLWMEVHMKKINLPNVWKTRTPSEEEEEDDSPTRLESVIRNAVTAGVAKCIDATNSEMKRYSLKERLKILNVLPWDLDEQKSCKSMKRRYTGACPTWCSDRVKKCSILIEKKADDLASVKTCGCLGALVCVPHNLLSRCCCLVRRRRKKQKRRERFCCNGIEKMSIWTASLNWTFRKLKYQIDGNFFRTFYSMMVGDLPKAFKKCLASLFCCKSVVQCFGNQDSLFEELNEKKSLYLGIDTPTFIESRDLLYSLLFHTFNDVLSLCFIFAHQIGTLEYAVNVLFNTCVPLWIFFCCFFVHLGLFICHLVLVVLFWIPLKNEPIHEVSESFLRIVFLRQYFEKNFSASFRREASKWTLRTLYLISTFVSMISASFFVFHNDNFQEYGYANLGETSFTGLSVAFFTRLGWLTSFVVGTVFELIIFTPFSVPFTFVLLSIYLFVVSVSIFFGYYDEFNFSVNAYVNTLVDFVVAFLTGYIILLSKVAGRKTWNAENRQFLLEKKRAIQQRENDERLLYGFLPSKIIIEKIPRKVLQIQSIKTRSLREIDDDDSSVNLSDDAAWSNWSDEVERGTQIEGERRSSTERTSVSDNDDEDSNTITSESEGEDAKDSFEEDSTVILNGDFFTSIHTEKFANTSLPRHRFEFSESAYFVCIRLLPKNVDLKVRIDIKNSIHDLCTKMNHFDRIVEENRCCRVSVCHRRYIYFASSLGIALKSIEEIQAYIRVDPGLDFTLSFGLFYGDYYNLLLGSKTIRYDVFGGCVEFSKFLCDNSRFRSCVHLCLWNVYQHVKEDPVLHKLISDGSLSFIDDKRGRGGVKIQNPAQIPFICKKVCGFDIPKSEFVLRTHYLRVLDKKKEAMRRLKKTNLGILRNKNEKMGKSIDSLKSFERLVANEIVGTRLLLTI